MQMQMRTVVGSRCDKCTCSLGGEEEQRTNHSVAQSAGKVSVCWQQKSRDQIYRTTIHRVASYKGLWMTISDRMFEVWGPNLKGRPSGGGGLRPGVPSLLMTKMTSTFTSRAVSTFFLAT
jgi:hypothetical protein